MLYVEALERYQQESVAGRIKRLRSIVSPLAGIKAERLQHTQAAGEIGETLDLGMNYSGLKDQ